MFLFFSSTADNYKLFQWVDSQKVTAPELIEYHEQLTAWENAVSAANNGNRFDFYYSHFLWIFY